MESVDPSRGNVRDTDSVIGSSDLNKRSLLVVWLADSKVPEASRTNTASSSVTNKLLVFVVQSDYLDPAVSSAKASSIERSSYSDDSDIGSFAGEE
jgi:hypothetical protein